MKHIREALLPHGVDGKNYSGHSFRIGAATTAAAVGVEDSMIKMMGRWQSSAYQTYIRTPGTVWQQCQRDYLSCD